MSDIANKNDWSMSKLGLSISMPKESLLSSPNVYRNELLLRKLPTIQIPTSTSRFEAKRARNTKYGEPQTPKSDHHLTRYHWGNAITGTSTSTITITSTSTNTSTNTAKSTTKGTIRIDNKNKNGYYSTGLGKADCSASGYRGYPEYQEPDEYDSDKENDVPDNYRTGTDMFEDYDDQQSQLQLQLQLQLQSFKTFVDYNRGRAPAPAPALAHTHTNQLKQLRCQNNLQHGHASSNGNGKKGNGKKGNGNDNGDDSRGVLKPRTVLGIKNTNATKITTNHNSGRGYSWKSKLPNVNSCCGIEN